jgi:hypothetical protein
MADTVDNKTHLRQRIMEQYEIAGDTISRREFSRLLDCLNNSVVELPQARPDGRATFPTKRACMYAFLIEALALYRADDKDLAEALKMIDRAALAGPDAYTIEGDPGKGWMLTFVPRPSQTRANPPAAAE